MWFSGSGQGTRVVCLSPCPLSPRFGLDSRCSWLLMWDECSGVTQTLSYTIKKNQKQTVYSTGPLCSGSVQAEQLIVTNTTSVLRIVFSAIILPPRCSFKVLVGQKTWKYLEWSWEMLPLFLRWGGSDVVWACFCFSSFLLLCSFLAVLYGEGCAWWVRWLSTCGSFTLNSSI